MNVVMPPNIFFTLDTPDGPFTIIADPLSQVLASGWTEHPHALTELIHPALRSRDLLPGDPYPHVERAVKAYYEGDATLLGSVDVLQRSGPFREKAWRVLRNVKSGEIITYTQFAKRSDNPRAVRAAASACAFNAAALFVPCHRIVRVDGTLGGYRWGLELKEKLIERESAYTSAAKSRRTRAASRG